LAYQEKLAGVGLLPRVTAGLLKTRDRRDDSDASMEPASEMRADSARRAS
jgi:hypothetical protein